jgi:LacI family transcriptional regulator
MVSTNRAVSTAMKLFNIGCRRRFLCYKFIRQFIEITWRQVIPGMTPEANELMKKFSQKNDRPTTVQQIAEYAEVSLGTVSHVLNNSVSVSEARRKRVLNAVEVLGYQRNQLARGLRRNATTMLGMLIPDIGNPFFPGIVRGAEDIAYKHGYKLVLCNTDDDANKEISYLNDLRSFFPAGLLIISAVGSTLLKNFRRSDPAIIFVDRCPEGWEGDFVMADNESGAYQAGTHLLELGHRRIAVITGPHHLSNVAARLNGFLRALTEANIKLNPGYIQEAWFNTNSGYVAATRLLQMLPRPTAIFASNDLLASGALLAAHNLGLRCPEDVSIVGFDDLEFVENTAPPLTTVHQSGYQIGETACRILLARIDDSSRPPVRVILPTEIKVRGSTMRPPVPGKKRVNSN